MNDIPGAKSRNITRKQCLRDTMDISDIEGAQGSKRIGGVRINLKNAPRTANLNVKDINYYMEFKSKRHTNPLNPTY